MGSLLAFLLAVAAIGFMLSGCASAPAPATIQVHCLPMVGYSKEDQAEILKELNGAPERQMLTRVLNDYLKMRDADVACVNLLPK